MIVLPAERAERLHAAPASWGWLDLVVLDDEGLAGVCGYSLGDGNRVHFLPRHELPDHELTQSGRRVRLAAVWYRANPEVQVAEHAEYLRGRGASISLDEFRGWIESGWEDPGNVSIPCLLEDRSQPTPSWTAWSVGPDRAAPRPLVEYDPDADPFDDLNDIWPPRRLLERAHIAVIGAGSIGAAAAQTLVGYGTGTISLIDDDRLEPRNIVRHICGPKDIGRPKVDAVAERLRGIAGSRVVNAYRWNVISHADHVRGLLRDHVDVALVCTDGVASRQTCAFLTRWAGVDAVFACVLADGAVGEVVRVPHRHGVGCLLCLRSHMHEVGEMDPEPGLDRGYGSGTAHRPMTAVGADLGLMGGIAAKVAVATHLRRAGYREHRLEGDHLVVGLQPRGDLDGPFETQFALTIKPGDLPPPQPGCAACATSPLHRPS